MKLSRPPEQWSIPNSIWRDSFEEMASDGRGGREGIALWLGITQGGLGHVRRAVFLRGEGARKERALLQVSSALMNDVTDVAIELGLVLLGQVHSHGPGWPIDLSPTDKMFGIAHPGYLSIVAPDYALSVVPPEMCGVHVFMSGVGYTRLVATEAARRVALVEISTEPAVIVGGGADEPR